ncbi:MAG: L,D-transpeptidase family protein [Actinobacteria bacterium]|nr:L,D-transpeptidase family protein [Actinomycetota bacterium]
MLAAVAAWQVLAVPRVSAVTPGPDSYVKNPSLTVVLDVKGLPKLKNVRVAFDGDDITNKATRSGDKLTFTTGKLSDGTHSVSFNATSSNLFRHEVRKAWRFTVDTSIPTLVLAGAADEGRINTSPASFSGTTEPYSTVTVEGGGVRASGQADASGKYMVSANLPDGPSNVTITTADRAGNATTKRLRVFVDASPPTLKTTQLDKTVGHSGLKIRIKARDQLGEPELKLVLDGETRDYQGLPSRAVFTVKNLAQGKHTMVITASDKGGNVVTDKQTFVIDSTEHFGMAVMWPGARGKDVKELQKKLADAGLYDFPKNGVYDNHTVTAVKGFQARNGMTVDGLVGTIALNALSGQIIVDLGDLRLYLYRNDKLVKSYWVATGQPAYPTPTGTYSIVTMTKDPTWLPPNSDWAKNAEPIPPGTENPLGTRWMGTSASGVGIHGVPPSEDGSIGSYASHGCIRMHNWDAVDLFDRVVIGMPVIIRQ